MWGWFSFIACLFIDHQGWSGSPSWWANPNQTSHFCNPLVLTQTYSCLTLPGYEAILSLPTLTSIQILPRSTRVFEPHFDSEWLWFTFIIRRRSELLRAFLKFERKLSHLEGWWLGFQFPVSFWILSLRNNPEKPSLAIHSEMCENHKLVWVALLVRTEPTRSQWQATVER